MNNSESGGEPATTGTGDSPAPETPAGSADNPIAATVGGRYSKYVLGVLLIVYVFNFIDRQIISILAEEIKADLGISDGDIGFLYGTAFAVFYAIFGIPLGKLADVWTRKSLISVGLAFWSLMTALSGTARSFAALATYRFGVGVGEASASPAAFSMLSDYFSPKVRATVLAVYSTGVYIGAGIGLFLGGVIVDAWEGGLSRPRPGAVRAEGLAGGFLRRGGSRPAHVDLGLDVAGAGAWRQRRDRDRARTSSGARDTAFAVRRAAAVYGTQPAAARRPARTGHQPGNRTLHRRRRLRNQHPDAEPDSMDRARHRHLLRRILDALAGPARPGVFRHDVSLQGIRARLHRLSLHRLRDLRRRVLGAAVHAARARGGNSPKPAPFSAWPGPSAACWG